MADNNEVLKQASAALDSAIADAKRNKTLIASIGPAVVEMMTPIITRIADDSRVTKEELMKALSAMTVNIEPQVNIPAVTLPDFKIPDFKIPQPKITVTPTVNIPEIKLPKIVVPKPEVTINPSFKIPEIKIPTQIVKFPDRMDVTMKDVTQKRPLPVFLMNPSSGSGARGGLTLSDIVTPSGASIIDNVNNALNVKLVGASSVSLSGVDFNIGPSGSQTIRTTIATDSVASVYITGSTGSIASALIDSSGVQYSGSNPVPVTFSSGVNVNQWNGTTTDTNIGPSGAGTLRVTIATDSNASVSVTNTVAENLTQIGGNTIAVGSGESNSNTIRVAFATDTNASTSVTNTVAENLTQVGGNTIAVGSGESNSNTIRVAFATDSTASVSATQSGTWNIGTVTTLTGVTNSIQTSVVDSTGVAFEGANPFPTNVTQIAGSAISTAATGIQRIGISDYNGASITVSQQTMANSLPVAIATDQTNVPTNIKAVNGNTIATASGESNSNTIRIAFATDSTASVQASGDTASGSTDAGNPVKIGYIATNTNVTRVSNAQRVNSTSDLAGRQIITPMHVREMRTTAYASLTSGSGANSETTLLAGSASTFFDLVKIVFANQSSGAVTIDLRDGTGGGIVETYVIPGTATVGSINPTEVPQNVAANTWTIKPNTASADLSGTTITCHALFTKNT